VQDPEAKGVVGNRGIPLRSVERFRQFLAAHEIVQIQRKDLTVSGCTKHDPEDPVIPSKNGKSPA
jgi:hypothetical protein